MPSPSHLRLPIALSIVAAIVTIGMKGTAYLLTDSVGLLSDTLESLINLLAAVTAYVALWYASRPADPNHTFGHEKIEYFSSGLEGTLIILAGLATAGYAIKRMVHPEPLQNLELGGIIGLAASGVNLVTARVLLYYGRKHDSIVLEADGEHLMADVWTSVGVIGGLGLVLLTGLEWFDPVLAVLVGGNIIWTGWELVVRSFNGLMDHALPVAEQTQIRTVTAAHLPAGATFHMLRTRRAGQRRFAEFHLLVNGDLTVRAAHHIAHEVQAALVAAMPGLVVNIHIEPIDEQESWEGEELKRIGETSDPGPVA
ncbi:MAG: cation diffusion facilitator family transporter [Planctomycetes bacterium]|nr:cation diffusion facilitator family transporter [Planctomycetota bacterium]